MKTNNRFLTTMLTSAAVLGMLSANAGAVRAVPSTHKLYVNNQLADVAAYNIEGNNYFKLRDIAKLVDFSVSYDPQVNCVTLTSNQPYQDDGSNVKTPTQSNADAKPSAQTIYVDGARQTPTVYNINGNNYFKLRDLGEMIDFSVAFTAATSRVDIDTEKPYAAEQTTPATGNADQGNNQNAAESTMKEVSNNPGYFYDTSLLTAIDNKNNTATFAEVQAQFDANAEELIRTWTLAMVDAVNEERRNAGLNELVIDDELMGFSQYWAQHLTTEFKHANVNRRREYAVAAGLSNLEPAKIDGIDDSTDKKIFDKVVSVGENIVRGHLYDNPVERLMKVLMESLGHKAAILYADNKTIGIGFAVSDKGVVCCCQNFGLVLYED